MDEGTYVVSLHPAVCVQPVNPSVFLSRYRGVLSVLSVKPVSFVSRQRQYHSQIDNLIEETVKEMTTLLVAKVTQADHAPGEGTSGQWRHTHIKIKSQNKDTPGVLGRGHSVADRLPDQRPQPCPPRPWSTERD